MYVRPPGPPYLGLGILNTPKCYIYVRVLHIRPLGALLGLGALNVPNCYFM